MSEKFTAAIIGAGTMGSGIAQKIAQEGIPVTLVDVTQEQVENGLQKIKDMLNEGIERGVFNEAYVEKTLNLITLTTDYNDLKDIDFIVEAVFENMDVKTAVLKQLDEVCKPEAILSSNTSSFYIRDLAKVTNRPDRFIGMHYFFHPAKNRLLEIISHDGTSEETVAIANKFADLHNKTAIVVKDSPGFAVNRFFVPWLTESVRLYEEGVANKATIDKAAEKTFKIGMGPFTLMNASGIPIAYHSANTLAAEISEFYSPPKTLADQVEANEFWDVEDGEVDESKFDIIAERLLATSIGAATALVDEGVASIEDTDRGAVVGLRWKTGPFQLANKYGVKYIYDIVKKLSDSRPGFPVAGILSKQAELDEPFDFNFIDYKVADGIATITINRPEAMNALNPTVVGQLEDTFNKAEADESVKAIVFRGAGKAFVAGADLKFFLDGAVNDKVEDIVEFTAKGHKLFRRMETSDKLTITILDGLSLGGGSELALSTQAIIATDKGSFGFPESGLGIYPGYGGMLRFNKHLGKELTKYYVLTGRGITAQQAHELGIVSSLVKPAEINQTISDLVEAGQFDKYADREIPTDYQEILTAFSDENIEKTLAGEAADGVSEEFAQKTAKTIGYKGPNSVKEIKHIIDEQTKLSIDDGIDYELSRLSDIFKSEEALVGLKATIAGKRADFSQFK
ncbi:enoyl-CoA hydratase/isomerase family protein [Aerococcaceae bacterium DSM 111021]|nr:enoyl-CoA hydratase/isomerase family protein [Aerococcaceae bacterium DSM 111021]